MCVGDLAYLDGQEGAPCEVQMVMRWFAGQWGEVHGSIHG